MRAGRRSTATTTKEVTILIYLSLNIITSLSLILCILISPYSYQGLSFDK